MDEQLLALVAGRIDGDASLSDEAGLLVLAACEGDDVLVATIAGETEPERPAQSAGPASIDDDGEPVEPAGAYLRSITAEGFRGVGSRTTLDLTAAPGLTLVVGRNGSGKSSFVEALEVLLTGDSRRWSTRKEKAWAEGWRNLHHPDTAFVGAEFAVDGVAATTTVTKEWPKGSAVGAAEAVVQTTGRKKAKLASLGWDHALAAYRPILSYNELGSILDEGPSKLYDALVSILGLDDLNHALARLTDVRKGLKNHVDRAKSGAQLLLARLRDLDDERAARCAALLEKRTWDLDAIGELVTGTAEADETSDLEVLRRFANLAAPDPDMVAAAVALAREAADLADAVTGTEADDADRTTRLLQAALEHHDHTGDGPCPVCGTTVLDNAWSAATREEVERLRRIARDAGRAADSVVEARKRLGALLVTPPASLPDAARLGLPVDATRAAWERWLDIDPDGDLRAAAAAVEEQAVELSDAVAALREAAHAGIVAREDRWSPVAEEVAGWLALARLAESAKAQQPAVEEAEQWLKSAIDDLRNQRLAPLAEQSARIWQNLSQHSNVVLGPMRLTGTATRRRVDLDVSVDGVDSVALAVMSQGELHALALAIFLPRVTLSRSPFRFLVIDDPVQAMDPAKVEGLARVLEDTARTRQVVVFTHDDRLPQAVRYLGIEATVIQVTRRAGSVVELAVTGDPAKTHLDDAFAVAHTHELPDDVRRRVVPGYCRLAIEAVLNDVVRRKLLGQGTAHDEVEDRLVAVTTLNKRAALALFGDEERGGDVLSRLGAYGKSAQDAYQAANKGTHDGYGGDLIRLVKDAEQLVEKLRTAP